MPDGILVAIISASALILASATTILVTKKKEREAAWRSKRLEYYEEFIRAASGIVDPNPPGEAKMLFANAVNNLHLVGSAAVLSDLHNYTDAIAESRRPPVRQEEHDELWSRLVWSIRADLGTNPTRKPAQFAARLWASGTKKPQLPFELQTFTEWTEEADVAAFDKC